MLNETKLRKIEHVAKISAFFLLSVFLFSKLTYLLYPIRVFLELFFVPFMLAFVLYFLAEPLLNFLAKHRVNKIISIMIIFFIYGLFAFYTFKAIIPTVQKEIKEFMSMLPSSLTNVELKTIELLNYLGYPVKSIKEFIPAFSKERIIQYAEEYSSSFLSNLVGGISSGFNILVNFGIKLFLVPVLLFFIMKDGHKFKKYIRKASFFNKHQEIILEQLKVSSDIFKKYVQGQIMVSLSVGLLTYIGFLMIGFEYAALGAFISFITNFVPFVGPFLGGVISVILALLTGWEMILMVLVTIIVVQQVESNLISPNILGKTLNIHPVTVIVVLLFAGKIFGIIGMLFAVPLFVIIKKVSTNVYIYIKEQKNNR